MLFDQTEHTNCVVVLESFDCELNVADEEGNLPITLAARLNLADVVVALIDSSRAGNFVGVFEPTWADVDKTDGKGRSALHWACFSV